MHELDGSIVRIERRQRFSKTKKLLGSLAMFTSCLMLRGDVPAEPATIYPIDEQVLFGEERVLFMSANVHGWVGEEGGNLDTFLAMLRAENPDVACLQEVFSDAEGWNWFRNSSGEVMREIRDAGYNVVFAATQDRLVDGPFGNAIISPFALTLRDVIELPNVKEGGIPRNVLVVNLETSRGSVPVSCTHTSTRRREALLQADYAAGRMSPVLLGADLNLTPDEAAETELMIPFSSDQMNATHSFPSNNPNRQIDYAISRCSLEGREEIHTYDFDSDHLAVFGLRAIHC